MQIRISSGQYKGLRLNIPQTELRPTEEKVRAALFNILYSTMDFEGKVFADLFAGSGAVGIEALSRGFARTLFFEKEKKALAVIEKNLQSLRISKEDYALFSGNSFDLSFIEKSKEHFDVIFIDPPYKDIAQTETLFLSLTNSELLNNDALIVIETGEPFNASDPRYISSQKKYGNTYLTIFRRNS